MSLKNKIVLGVDPSSTSTGVAKYKNGKITYIDVWKKDKKISLENNLFKFGEFLDSLFPANIIVIENLSVPLNLDTVKKISYYQGLAIYKGTEWKAEVVLLRPSEARKLAYGKGNLPKEEIYNIVSKKHNLLDFKKGGSDQADAITLIEAYVARET
jgi:Holliday junction resolvasome RuvABC endonuclease subunit